jgi:hypothetical protein
MASPRIVAMRIAISRGGRLRLRRCLIAYVACRIRQIAVSGRQRPVLMPAPSLARALRNPASAMPAISGAAAAA